MENVSKNKKILITGGCGCIGSNACLFYLKKNYTVICLDNLDRFGSKYNLIYLKK
jgi:nucleoside-diphosphate-sugar epimerase